MVNSLLKAIDLLCLFSPAEPRLTLTEMSQRLGLPKSTVHNLLATLLSRGFIERVDNDRYALGTAAISLTQAVRVNVEIRDRAAPLLRQMADTVRESVYLTVLDGDYSLYIYAIESPHRLLARTAVGDRVLLHCTSVGKAIMAWLPSETIDEIVGRVGLPGFTPATITSVPALQHELARTRARGYAIDEGEHEVGAYCLGAPIRDTSGTVVAACSIAGRDTVASRERTDELATIVMTTADEISRRLGYVSSTPSQLASALLLRST